MMRLLMMSALAAFGGAVPALAQDANWNYSATSYLWFPQTTTGMETPRGTAEAELSAKDALENLDMGIMLTGQAQRDRWSLVGDLIYLDVDGSSPSPFGLLYSDVAAESKLTSISAFALYQVWQNSQHSLDLGAGLRAVKTDLTMTFRAGILPQSRIRIQDDWIDPVLALRYSGRLSDRWTGHMSLDYGGFGIGSASDETWQAVASLGYQLNDRWSLLAGYRHLQIDQEKDGLPYRLELSGPVFGLNIRF